MKIADQRPNRSRLQVNKLKTAMVIALFGSVSVVIQLAPIVFFGKLATLTCQRVEATERNCKLVHSGLLGSDETTIPLNQLQSAEVHVNEYSDGDTYRVVLLTNNGYVPFTSMSSSGAEEKQKNADLINAFISNPGKTSLRVQQDDRWFIYQVGRILLLFNSPFILGLLRNNNEA